MKKILILMMSLALFLSVAVAQVWAEGGKVQGDNGQGTTTTTHDPAPFEWPGIDW